MKSRFSCFGSSLVFVLWWVCAASSAQNTADVSHWVNPFIGTASSVLHSYPRTMPGAMAPFGMLFWSPDPTGAGFYHQSDSSTSGFSLTHVDGAGCRLYGDVRILPIEGTIEAPPPQVPLRYLLKYRPDSQVAQPGFYSVTSNSGTTVELVAAKRSGLARVSFAKGTPHTVLIDLSRNLTQVADAEISVNGNSISGSIAGAHFCQADNRYRLYFSIETAEPETDRGTFNEIHVEHGNASRKGPRVGGFITFAPEVKVVLLRVGISYVSVANARLNAHRETPSWDFDRACFNSRAAWNDVLSRIRIRGGTDAQRRSFYTGLYHAFLGPMTFSDVNGDYMGFDGKTHHDLSHVHYDNISAWDIYRCQMQLIAILFPKVASDIAQSLVDDATQGGGFPLWPVANDDAHIMDGDPAAIIIADAYAFGARDFDFHAALRLMIRGAEDPSVHCRLYPERPYLNEYLQEGYVAQDAAHPSPGSASITLEYATADFAIAQLAQSTGDAIHRAEFLARSANWQKLFDPSVGYIRARMPDGHFQAEFDVAKDRGYMEGNAAQYTLMVPFDLARIIQLMGGNTVAIARLDNYFSEYGSVHVPHFYIGNEPSFGDPWIYNWTTSPWKAQEVVHNTLKSLFGDTYGSLPGNDDLGATSAWAVLAYLGLYPEIPGVGGVTINTPTFPAVDLRISDHTLAITARGVSDHRFYTHGVTLDGKQLDKFWIPWNALAHAKTIAFSVEDVPDRRSCEKPPSFSIGRVPAAPRHIIVGNDNKTESAPK